MKVWIVRAVLALWVALGLVCLAGAVAKAVEVNVTLRAICLPGDAAAEMMRADGLVLLQAFHDPFGQRRERWESPDGPAAGWAEVGIFEVDGARGFWRCLLAMPAVPGEPS